jgi:RimJ/RimL family protein N-acetyltransferase
VEFPGEVVTARLVGRRPADGDLEDYVRFWTDPRVPEAVWPAALRTRADAEDVLREGIAHWERWGFGPWTVLERGRRAVVGRVGLAHTGATGRPEVEVVWFFDAAVWGRGYATEMAREAVRAAFGPLGLTSVVSSTTPPNAASQAVMRKLGFRYEAGIEHAGLPHVLYRLRRDDGAPAYQASPGR